MPTPYVKPTQVMLGLPAERHAQLRALAAHRGVTAVEIVERTIRAAIEVGEISDDLPGLCTVERVGDDMLDVTIRGYDLPHLDRLQADAFALLLTAAAGWETLPDREFKAGSAISFTLDNGHKLYVGRNASAVLIGVVDGETGQTVFRTSTTASLACDFAVLLRKHSTKMKPSLIKVMPDGSFASTDLLNRILNSENAMPSITNNEVKS